jgi:heat-inducible transcriptional repressor
MGPHRLLIVLILSTGRVEQRVVELADELGPDTLADLRSRILGAVVGERIIDAAAALGLLTEQVSPRDTTQMAVIAAALVEAMSNERNDERVLVGGTANLARFGDGFDQSIKPMLEALEEHVVLLKLLGEATSSDSITVRIGHEGPYQELATTSVIATGYGPGAEAVGSLGIVGPTRMDYPGSMAAVRAVARYVSTILDQA